MTKTEDEIIKELKDLLLLYKDIFEFGTEGSIRKTMPKKDNYSDDSNAYIDLYFPKKIPLDTRGGYKLKNNQGYVSIKETYIYKNNIKLNGEAVAYVYRYISEEGTEYLCYDSKSDASFPYNFHYDKDLKSPSSISHRELHPENHLQVLHNSPRFYSEKMNLEKFLEHIKSTFFQEKDLAPFPCAIFKR